MADTVTEQFYKFGKNGLIEATLRIFYFIGMWPQQNSTVVYSVVGYTFQAITSLAWTISKSIATVMLEKRIELILFGPTTVYAYTNIYRGFVIMRKQKAIDSILEDVSDLLLTKNEYDRVQQKMKFFNKMSLVYITFITLGLVSASVNPIVSHWDELPVPIWLPFNSWKTNRQDYIVALLFSYAGIGSIVFSCSFTPILVWNVKEVEDTFAGVFFYQISSSAICICSIAYLMADSSSNESNNFLMYLALGGIYIYEIFVLVYYANEVALTSDQLSYRLYESNWIGMPVKYQKMMIILMEKWKKPTEFLVGKVFAMRINILTSILNVAYSILNVLRKGQQ